MSAINKSDIEKDLPLVILGEEKDYPDSKQGRQDCLIDLLIAGHSVSGAAKELGISRGTVYYWIENDDAFKERFHNARGKQITIVEDALYRRATGGNIAAIVFYLCNRAPGQWQHVSTIEHRIMPDAFIRPAPELKKLSTDDLNKLREIANRAGNLELPRIVDTNATEIRPAPQRKHGDNGSNGTGDSGSPDPKP